MLQSSQINVVDTGFVCRKNNCRYNVRRARVAKLVDATDLGSVAVRCVGSSPTSGTTFREDADV